MIPTEAIFPLALVIVGIIVVALFKLVLSVYSHSSSDRDYEYDLPPGHENMVIPDPANCPGCHPPPPTPARDPPPVLGPPEYQPGGSPGQGQIVRNYVKQPRITASRYRPPCFFHDHTAFRRYDRKFFGS